MLINKKALEIASICPKSDPIYSLHGVHFTADGAMVATDGKVLAIVRPDSPPDSEFPVVPGVELEPANGEVPVIEPFTVAGSELAKVQKAIPRNPTMPVLNCARLVESETNKNGEVVFAVTDLESGQAFRIRKSEKVFPAYDKIMPKGRPTTRIGLDWKLLAKLGKVADAAIGRKASESHTLILEIYGENAAVGVKVPGENGDNPRFVGVIMPVKIDS